MNKRGKVAFEFPTRDKYPSFTRRDEVLCFLGQTLWDMERYSESLTAYKELLKNFPKSIFVPDCYLAFGEYYFNQASKGSEEMLNKALMAYRKATHYPDSPVYLFSLFKQGWCYFNLHENEKAKEFFETVMQLDDKAPAEKKRPDIREDASRALELIAKRTQDGAQ